MLFTPEILAQAGLHDAGSTIHDNTEDRNHDVNGSDDTTDDDKKKEEEDDDEEDEDDDGNGNQQIDLGGGTGETEGNNSETPSEDTSDTQNLDNSNDPEEFSIEFLEELPTSPSPEASETSVETPVETPPETSETSVETSAETPPDVPNETFPEPQVEFTSEGGENSVNDAGGEAVAQLSAGTFGDGTGISVSPSVQTTLLSLLTGDPTSKSLFGDPLLNPLIRNLGQGGAGNLLSWQLAKSLLGLLRGDKVHPKKLLAAVAAYNALIKASGDDFLVNPPAELVAIRAVLAELVKAAEAEYRTPDN